ncbi:hypothetical protein [Aureimonas psammosilenae]|uniref:hypothetical protein n=1 Tax=Aureimonas psammosilenae TaxID=2495496 RepID=UPI001869E832|nr:hypothetical protein [Aureimonas psammosilenae]
MDREKTTPETTTDEAVEDRQAVADERSRQDFGSEKSPAEGHTTFGDDRTTPRLNDGR